MHVASHVQAAAARLLPYWLYRGLTVLNFLEGWYICHQWYESRLVGLLLHCVTQAVLPSLAITLLQRIRSCRARDRAPAHSQTGVSGAPGTIGTVDAPQTTFMSLHPTAANSCTMQAATSHCTDTPSWLGDEACVRVARGCQSQYSEGRRGIAGGGPCWSCELPLAPAISKGLDSYTDVLKVRSAAPGGIMPTLLPCGRPAEGTVARAPSEVQSSCVQPAGAAATDAAPGGSVSVEGALCAAPGADSVCETQSSLATALALVGQLQGQARGESMQQEHRMGYDVFSLDALGSQLQQQRSAREQNWPPPPLPLQQPQLYRQASHRYVSPLQPPLQV
jgi:hypothetical protein